MIDELLRNEIIESQKVRSDLLKWKLVIVAALGAAGFGLIKENSNPYISIVLCFIPLLCLYVDILCKHLNLRMFVIGSYFRLKGVVEYEDMAEEARQLKLPQRDKFKSKEKTLNAFELEDFALHISTYILSILVIVCGFIILYHWGMIQLSNIFYVAFFISGVFGLVFSKVVDDKYKQRAEALSECCIRIQNETPSEIAARNLAKKKEKVRLNRITPPAILNPALSKMHKSIYNPRDIKKILEFLKKNGTFNFPTLSTGLFSAAGEGSLEEAISGYKNVWIRDNVYITFSQFMIGKTDKALPAMESMAAYFGKHIGRFQAIIDGNVDPSNPMERPHVRFNGESLTENTQKWAHDQNDALGYFLWLYCKMIDKGIIGINKINKELLLIISQYFNKIRYWEDEDSGHWEEIRKISASSIGVATAGLKALKKLLLQKRMAPVFLSSNLYTAISQLEDLIEKGLQSLKKILPHECIQSDPKKNRPNDAALLFLIYPMEIVDDDTADLIIDGVETTLKADHGFRRYIGDSYWAANYRLKLAAEERTVDFSDSLDKRDALLKPGEEAQWCIFDSILSVIYGKKYKKNGNPIFHKMQTHYFNRSLSQITKGDEKIQPLKCPEAYFIENDEYVPNDHVPLLWAQANLLLAFYSMFASLEEKKSDTEIKNYFRK